ncbi:MAG TPA: arylsulfotransferase family protein [Albidovulum sp.]|uniref:arylsulfotransferase family protein n=1 Tax=Albidovulum sp. TaxID=1872424 RepID=UPI002BE8338D|nr:arylsulfotransferase family protein [Albidovulum sp.]
MEKAKLVSLVAGGALVLGGTFTAGLYSAVRQNAAYDLVWGTLDQAKTLYEELPNLRGTEPIHFLRPAKYPGQGVTVNDPAAGQDDLILLSGFYDGNNKVRLLRRDGAVLNEWTLSARALFPDASFFRLPPATDWNAITHGTIITPEGDIIFSFESGGVARLDRCGKPVWTTPGVLGHHSPNWLDDGGVVIAGGKRVTRQRDKAKWPYSADYWEDLVYKFAPDGKLTLQKPLTELMVENDLQGRITATGQFSTRINGEFHLNDVEELPASKAAAFPMFEAGDLLLSLRNFNAILVTDSEVKRVKWYLTGPFIRQHDPDWQADGTITLFDNHSDETLDGTRGGGSRILKIDPATDKVVTLYGGRQDQPMYSPERSTHQMQPDGNILITEAQSGRAFEVTPAGKIVWEYINRYDDSRVTWLHDAEIIDPSYFTVKDWNCGG